MSNSGVSAGFAKCFIFFMATVILIQGGVYLGLSIWAITLRQCSKRTTDVSGKPIQFAIDLVYFLNKNCDEPSIKLPDLPEPITLNVDFNKAEPNENRTLAIFIAYAVISLLWVVTSLTVITTLCGRITKTVNGLCFWPWYLIILAGSILDVVATGYHIHDILNTTSVVKTFEYLSITTDEQVIEALSNFNAYFVAPAVIMAAISSRLIFIWLLNIFGSSFCLSLSSTLVKMNTASKQSSASLASTSTYPIANIQQQPEQDISSIQTQQVAISSIQMENSQRRSAPPPQHTFHRAQSDNVAVENVYATAPPPIESRTNTDVGLTHNNVETHTDKLNYPPLRNTSQYLGELSISSPLNNRYSTTNESFQFSMQNPRVSEELRGQLPWSYISMPPPAPKKTQLQIYPEIPAPDYGS